MTTTKKTPPIVQIGLWLVSLLVFAIGFWHTHLGLKEMRPFGSEWGSLAIAGIFLLPMLITYWYAVNGKKMALIFYVFYGIIFFVCNLNYFYPAYLARQIVKEEAVALNDTLQNYKKQSNTLLIKNIVGFEDNKNELVDYENLKLLKKKIVVELKSFRGWGPEASTAFASFNEIIEKHGFSVTIFTAGNMTSLELANVYDSYLEGVIQKVLEMMVVNSKDGGVTNALSFIKGIAELDSLEKNYTTVLRDSIIPDKSEIKLGEVQTHPQINILVKLVTGINEATSKINSATKPDSFKFQVVEEPQSPNLGRIAFTFQSIKERNAKMDTWGIIILCLFVNLILPLAIYLHLRKKSCS